MKKRNARVMAATMSVAMIASSLPVSAAVADPSAKTNARTATSFDAEEFASPSVTYRPGVRWWWSGGAVEKDEIKEELDYLAEYGFGYVEIQPFNVSETLEGEENYNSVYTERFYEMVDYAATIAEQYGITVDLNMGSGWNANSQYVTESESMGNMALGRNTVKGSDITATVTVPAAEKSKFYDAGQKGNWSEEDVQLQGVLIAKVTGEGGTLSKWNTVNDEDPETAKTYTSTTVLDMDTAIFEYPAADGSVTLTDDELAGIDASADYEVVAVYFVPSGGYAIDCVNEWYTVDHLDKEDVADYLTDWLTDPNLAAVLEKHDNIRALFNDSYEFYSDMYYTEEMMDLAKDAENNAVGYDYSKYLALNYKETSAAPFYMIMFGMYQTNGNFLSTGDSDVMNRLQYDYNCLVNQKFEEGLASFQEVSNANGYLYRQEAYNPPVDEIGAAEYVDIPETEQGNELSLKTVTSGAHLYGRNLSTCEQYTLGTVPFTNSLESVKIGYDIMATSGVNNFFYHGFAYHYGENTELYGENGWAAFPSIGINVTDKNTLARYFKTMNAYASRVNYLMQQGNESKDVAYYCEFNTDLSNTDAVKTLNYNGYSWDAINDDSIQSETTTVLADGSISVNGGNMVYDAIVIDRDTLPLATVKALKALAEAGATIVYANVDVDTMTNPSYCAGTYETVDAEVRSIVKETVDLATGYDVDGDEVATVLATAVNAPVSYTYNENVRFARRTLADGSEVAYIRNLSADENQVTITVDDSYGACYWLDQNTGKVYPAEVKDGKIEITMTASEDVYSSAHSMAIGLLCLPQGQTLAADEVSEGTPDCIVVTKTSVTKNIDVESLSVTADNFDGVLGGETETKVYTENVLGKWNDETFQNGELQTIVADGIYTMHYNVTDKTATTYELNLGSVYTAAEVTVNGQYVGQLCYNPYSIDVTDALVVGDNEIVVAVTPRKANRYYGITDGQYSRSVLIDAGMEGPVTMTESYDVDALKEAVKKAEEEKAALQAKLAQVVFQNLKPVIKYVKSTSKKKVLVALKKLAGASGYQIRYSTKKSMSGAKKITVKSLSKTLSGLKSGKRVYFQIRAYKTIAGVKVYTKYSSVKSIKVK